MKNYLKVTLGGRNLGIFPFDDQDEVATHGAVTRAKTMREGYGARIVCWTPTGLVAHHFFYVVGDADSGPR